MLPIIGRKKQAEKLAQLNQEANIEYQMEMSKKLEQFEIENECFVRAILVENKTQSNILHQAITMFYKMSNEQLNEYKIKINQRENQGLINKAKKNEQSKNL